MSRKSSMRLTVLENARRMTQTNTFQVEKSPDPSPSQLKL